MPYLKIWDLISTTLSWSIIDCLSYKKYWDDFVSCKLIDNFQSFLVIQMKIEKFLSIFSDAIIKITLQMQIYKYPTTIPSPFSKLAYNTVPTMHIPITWTYLHLKIKIIPIHNDKQQVANQNPFYC